MIFRIASWQRARRRVACQAAKEKIHEDGRDHGGVIKRMQVRQHYTGVSPAGPAKTIREGAQAALGRTTP